jgi:hypothetical protein
MKTLRLLFLLLGALTARAASDVTIYTGDNSTNTLGTNSFALIVWDGSDGLGRIYRMPREAMLTNLTALGLASTNLLESVSNVVASLAIANDTTTSNALRTTFIANDTTTSNGLYSLIGSATSGTNFHHIRVTNDIYAAGSVLIPAADADSVVITDSNKKLTTGPTTAAALALIANLSTDAEARLDNLDGSTNALNAKTNFVNLNASEGITSRTARATAIRLTGSTASRAVVLNASGDLTNATTTAAEIEHVSGVTSAIQTQFNAKAGTNANGTINMNRLESGFGSFTNGVELGASPSANLLGAPTNSVPITNLLGLVHLSSASVLAIDANQSHHWSVTNPVAAPTSLVITNTADGQELSIYVKGEVSGGTSRVITLIPHTGQLIVDEDDFSVAPATSSSFTLTNGNTAEIRIAVRRLNGTNTLGKVHRQFKF